MMCRADNLVNTGPPVGGQFQLKKNKIVMQTGLRLGFSDTTLISLAELRRLNCAYRPDTLRAALGGRTPAYFNRRKVGSPTLHG